LNHRLHPVDLIYLINHAGDRVIIVDEVLWPLFQKAVPHLPTVEHIIVISDRGAVPEGTLGYEQLLANADPADYQELDLNEQQAAAMCYTSGTTGRPKGVLYSHRSLVLHTLGLLTPVACDMRESDTITPVVPMFHVNAWGLPF